MIEILDSKGDEESQVFLDMWISFGQGFLLVFSINDYESFEFIKTKYKRILNGKHSEKCPFLLIGNKKDLKNERVVPYSEAKEWADSWKIEYCEISTKNDFDFQKILEKIIKKYIIIEKEKEYRPYNRSPCFWCCIACIYYCFCCFLCERI